MNDVRKFSSGTTAVDSRRSSHGNDQQSDNLTWHSGGTLLAGEDTSNAAPFYPSVAHRIAVWRNMTAETSHTSNECHSTSGSAALELVHVESPQGAANGYDGGMTEGANHSIIDRLVAELNASRKRNKKLAMKLASVERQVQEMQIEHGLQDERLEAAVACRVADALNTMLLDRLSTSIDVSNPPHIRNALSDLTDQKGGTDMLSMDDCRSIISYIREHGCQLPPSSGPHSQVQEAVRPGRNSPCTHDVGTDARNGDDEAQRDNGGDHVTLALSNANRELLIENAKLREELDEATSKTHSAEDECNQLRVQLENCKNRNTTALEEENIRLKEAFEKLKRRYEQAEAKWEREAYELREKYQSADEENFRLTEELKTLQRQMANQSDGADLSDSLDAASERVRLLTEENTKLLAKNDELNRLVTVLRRKLSATTTK